MHQDTIPRLKFCFCGILVILQSVVMVSAAIVLGIIPSLCGYGDNFNCISHTLYYNVIKRIIGVSVEHDKESRAIFNQIKEPVIFVTNHQTSLDLGIIGSMMNKKGTIISKKQNMYIPFIGLYLYITGTIFVDRNNKKKNISVVDQVAEAIHKRKVSIWIFPEGTRSHTSEPGLLPFKSGAFHMAVRAKVPIVPVVFENYHHIYDEKNKLLRSGKIACKVLPPISTDNIGEDNLSIEKLSDECHIKMLDTLYSFNNKKERN